MNKEKMNEEHSFFQDNRKNSLFFLRWFVLIGDDVSRQWKFFLLFRFSFSYARYIYI